MRPLNVKEYSNEKIPLLEGHFICIPQIVIIIIETGEGRRAVRIDRSP